MGFYLTEIDDVTTAARPQRAAARLSRKTPYTPSSRGGLSQGREYSWKAGLYFFRARWYDPVTGRWLSNDPIGIAGGLNQYVFCGNNPVNFTDPSGLCTGGDDSPYASRSRNIRSTMGCHGQGSEGQQRNARFLFDFFTGGGETSRTYYPWDIQLQEMQASPGAEAMRGEFNFRGHQNIGPFEYRTGQAFWDTAIVNRPFNNTALQVGGFNGATVVNNSNGTATFTIPNTAGANSFFYHIPFIHDRESPTGPFRTIQQTFQWTEPVK